MLGSGSLVLDTRLITNRNGFAVAQIKTLTHGVPIQHLICDFCALGFLCEGVSKSTGDT